MADLRQPDKPEDSEWQPPRESLAAGHEVRDVRIAPIVWAGVGLLIFAVVVHVLVLLLQNALASQVSKASPPANPLAGAYGLKAPPQPRLQTEPLGDLGQLHAAEDAALNGYGWVDKQSGVVRIPIERAMELMAEAAPAENASGGPVPAPPGGPRESGGSGEPQRGAQ